MLNKEQVENLVEEYVVKKCKSFRHKNNWISEKEDSIFAYLYVSVSAELFDWVYRFYLRFPIDSLKDEITLLKAVDEQMQELFYPNYTESEFSVCAESMFWRFVESCGMDEASGDVYLECDEGGEGYIARVASSELEGEFEYEMERALEVIAEEWASASDELNEKIEEEEGRGNAH